ncbi:unnamed protein product [Amaranthus hypochondriacus]
MWQIERSWFSGHAVGKMPGKHPNQHVIRIRTEN